ncbi:hypothetical protein FIBSPDRAFT_877097 [Athelia psychrophila]|uniref:Uncharacterized protein n=1 Tax=Athelia psychrophila TaxID=1759441 RepID=A0A167W9C3_9AGAM|nr:hypothetical protein FIBSPDRAFT_877097 [Fibularhizoctonia sp. CBS 109695]
MAGVNHEAPGSRELLDAAQYGPEPLEMVSRQHYPRTRQVRDHFGGLEGGEAPLERAGEEVGED